jgi:hypothetical protein
LWKCPWKGLGQKAVAENYAKRLEEMNSMASDHTAEPPGIPTGGYENQAQSTSKYLARGFKMPMRQKLAFQYWWRAQHSMA